MASPPVGSQLPRRVSTRPNNNPFTPPIPAPTTDVNNLRACIEALKASTESLTGQRGDASNRAVTFRDLIGYGVLHPDAVTSPNPKPPGINFSVGPGLSYNGSTTPPTLDVATPYVALHGDTMTGFLTLLADPVAPLHAATKQYVDAAITTDKITLLGDVTGTGTTEIDTTLATVNAAVGTFQGITVNAKGLVTGAVNQNYLTAGAVGTTYVAKAGDTMTGALNINVNATGAMNRLQIANTGTATTSGTSAGLILTLTGTGGANDYAYFNVSGGATPAANLSSGPGLTGGFLINATAGNLTLESGNTVALVSSIGSVTAPTPSPGDNSTRVATTAFVTSATGAYLPLAGGTLSGALNVNVNATGVINQLQIANTGTATTSGTASGLLLTLLGSGGANDYAYFNVTGGATPTANLSSGPGLTGGLIVGAGSGTLSLQSGGTISLFSSTANVIGPTPPTADNSTKLATTAFVKAQAYTTGSGYLQLSGGTMTGTIVGSPLMLQAGSGPILRLQIATPQLTLITTNTAGNSQIEVSNSGTVSNASTEAGFVAWLDAGTNTYVGLDVIGGAAPTARLFSGSGMTGGLSIQSGAGNITAQAPGGPLLSLTTSQLALAGALTGVDLAFVANNTGTASNAGTLADVFAILSGLSNGYIGMRAAGGAVPSAALFTGAGLTGGLGISTSAGQINITPATTLVLSGNPVSVTTNLGINIPALTSSVKLGVQGSGTTSATYQIYTQDSAGTLKFYVRDDGQSYHAGLVGIGVGSPQYNLDVATAMRVGSAAGSLASPTRAATNLILYDAGATNWAGVGAGIAGDIYFVTGTSAPATRMVINPSGNVGIATTAAGSPLTVNGACANVSGAWTTISDVSVKQDVRPYTRGLDAIVALKPVEFRYRAGTPFADEDAPSRPLFGLIADEVRPIVPEIVGVMTATIGAAEDVELSTLEPANLIFAMINAMRELEARLTQVEGKLR